MLRLSVPTHWASTLVRQAFGPPGAERARRRARWVRHPDGQEELLLRPHHIPNSEDGVDSEVMFHALLDERTLEHRTGDTRPGQAVVWVSRDGRWTGSTRPHSHPTLRMPCISIDELWLPGPGMHMLPATLAEPGGAQRSAPMFAGSGSAAGWLLALGSRHTPDGAFSRQAGALGWSAVDALRSRRYALVGCGRTGHALALQLASWEPREIVLIDADTLEPGNRDAGLAYLSARAHPGRGDAAPAVLKVQALADLVQRHAPLTRVVTVGLGIEASQSLRAAASCDVIISATDHDAARLCCAAVAQSFHRVHLDLGSLVSTDTAGRANAGADVRLLLPGDRDLCCLGGFAIEADLERFALDPLPDPTSNWRERKAGALTSWSTFVASLGMRLLEELAANRLSQSRWVRITQSQGEPIPVLRELTSPLDRHCPLCAIAGLGPEWLPRMRDLAAAALIRSRSTWSANRASSAPPFNPHGQSS